MNNMYKCPACKRLVSRDDGTPTIKSYCLTAGKDVVLEKVKKVKK